MSHDTGIHMHQLKLHTHSILLTALVVLAILLVACGGSPASVSTPTATPAPKRTVAVAPPTTTPMPTAPVSTPTPIQPAPFSITRIDMSVSPSSIAGTVC